MASVEEDRAKKEQFMSISKVSYSWVSGCIERKQKLEKEKWAKKLGRAQDIRGCNGAKVSSITPRVDSMDGGHWDK